jgi:preprotein translocase subunit SecG
VGITLVGIIHISVCVFLILIVLLQQGKGADMGATFGGGSQTVFGASGADNLLTKVTTTVAVLFMITSIFLTISSKPSVTGDSKVLGTFQEEPATTTAPVSKEAKPADTEAVKTEPFKAEGIEDVKTETTTEAETKSPAPTSETTPAETEKTK